MTNFIKFQITYAERTSGPLRLPHSWGGFNSDGPQPRLRGFIFTIGTGKHLRSNETGAEKALWKIIRGKALGYKFRRQHGIGPFIVDFYCDAARLVIELDGNVHDVAEVQSHDKEREKYLTELGYKILRFRNEEIFDNLQSVLNKIQVTLGLSPSYGGVGGGQ